MNPLSLRATNYRTFESLELDLPEGCLAVVGENGAGKSSIVNVIDLALFGPEGRSLAEYLSDDASGSELEIELTFEHAGEMYRVRRGFSARGRGKTMLDFEQAWLGEAIEHHWQPLTRETQKATQEAIEETLGLSRETFRASAFLAQGDGAAFTEAVPRDRKRILAEVLGLTVWDRLREAAGSDRRKTERLLAELDGRIAHIEASGPSDLVELEESCSRLRALCSEAESEHATRQRMLDDAAVAVRETERAEATFRERAAAVEVADARLSERQAVVERAAQAKLEAVEVQRELSEAGDPPARLAELEAARIEMDRKRERRREAERERDMLLAEAHELRRQAVRLNEEREGLRVTFAALSAKTAELNDPAKIPHCDRCEQELRGDSFEIALTRIREERDAVLERLAAYGERITAANYSETAKGIYAESVEIPSAVDEQAYADTVNEIQRLRQAELHLAGLRQKLASLETQIAAVTPEVSAEVALLQTALEDARAALAEIDEPEPGALDALRVRAVEAKALLDIVDGRLTESRADLVRAETALEQATKLAEELAHAKAEREALLDELDLLSLLERAYGRDGLPALIVESSAIPQIETEANRILAELGTSYRVELRTQRELKSGDGLADTLDVVVIGEVGARSYETFSGGERTRINLALRIALARLLAHRRGAESRLLAIDEPEYLDEAGTARLADVLRGLDGEFERIVLVSHVPTLRDAFDQTLEVRKENGRSVVIAA